MERSEIKTTDIPPYLYVLWKYFHVYAPLSSFIFSYIIRFFFALCNFQNYFFSCDYVPTFSVLCAYKMSHFSKEKKTFS